MMQRISDYIMKRLAEKGAEHIFFVPGSGCGCLVDALAKNKEIQAINVNHEQAAGMAALTYAQITGKLGACVVTTGCGGTNAITALLHAWQDNIPCVFVSGQVEYKHTIQNSGLNLRQFGRQETNIVGIVSSICKYAVTITDPKDAVYEVEKALFIAESGRKGPVWIDVPLNIQAGMVELDDSRHYEGKEEEYAVSEDDMDYFWKAFMEAERPIVLAGNGIRLAKAEEELKKFLYKYELPMVHTRLGNGLISAYDRHSIGMAGSMGASRAGSFAIQNADMVICLGSRLSINTTGYEYEKFARGAKLIVVDIDEVEHTKKTVKIDHFIHSDVKEFLKLINSKDDFGKKYFEWLEKCVHWKNTMPIMLEEFDKNGKMDMYYLAERISDLMPEDAVVVSDAGDAFYIGSSGFKYKDTQTCITSGGQGEMGFALPGAIGAAFAAKRPVIVFTGDGSIMMNIQELATVAHYKLPIKIIVINNNGYACIRKGHKDSYRRYIGCDAEGGLGMPSFEKMAYGFEIKYLRANNGNEFDHVLKEAFAIEGPVIIEAMCKEVQELLMVALTKNKKRRLVTSPIEDQAPFMPRETFMKEMIVAPLE